MTAAVSTNFERSGKRDCASFNLFLSELAARRSDLGIVKDVLYQYCGTCHSRLHGLRLFLTSEYTSDTAVLRRNLSGRSFAYVSSVNPYTWDTTVYVAAENGSLYHPHVMSAEEFIAWKASFLAFPGHSCPVPANLVDVGKINGHVGDASTRAMLSTLARCVQDASPFGGVGSGPVRDLDMDTVIVNRVTGRIAAVIEETSTDATVADAPSRMRVLNNKVCVMSDEIARNTGASLIRIAGFSPTTVVSDDAISAVSYATGSSGSIPLRFNTYTELLDWCVSSLG